MNGVTGRMGANQHLARSIAEIRRQGGVTLKDGTRLMPDPVLVGRIVLMASRALAACARSPDDYGQVYDRVLAQVKQPVIIHWLGEMFDPALEGYWGRGDHAQAMEVCLDVIRKNAAKVDGIKVSLLDQHKEIAMRRRLPSHAATTGDARHRLSSAAVTKSPRHIHVSPL